MTLKGGYVPVKMDDIGDFNSKVNRGCGKHKKRKGTGSYTRKEKHKARLVW